jgi:S1-C subfamily serine protease
MALIPPSYLNAVVSIELPQGNKPENKNRTIATGFLYGKLVSKNIGEKTSNYSIYLVTNRHVFEDNQTNLIQKVLLRFNLTEKRGTKCFPVDLVENGKPRWFKHKDKKVDLAIIKLNGKNMVNEGIDFYYFRSDTDAIFTKNFDEKGISTGDGIYVLGFPLGLRGNDRNYTIVKSGCIARVDDEILKKKYFYIDSSAYPGNSGGPVIYKPEAVSIQGTKAVLNAGLIGVISAGETFSDIAISQQTGRARIVFEEQIGLVRIVPIDLIDDAINQYIVADKKTQKIADITNHK